MFLLSQPLQVNPLGHDRHLLPILLLLQQPHLLKDKVDLLPPVHRPKRLNLQFLHQVRGGVDVSGRLFDSGEDTGDAGTGDFEVDLRGKKRGKRQVSFVGSAVFSSSAGQIGRVGDAPFPL